MAAELAERIDRLEGAAALSAEDLLARMGEQTLTEGEAAAWAAHADAQALWSVLDEAVQLLHEAFGFLETPHAHIATDARVVQRQAGVVAALFEAADIERSDGCRDASEEEVK